MKLYALIIVFIGLSVGCNTNADMTSQMNTGNDSEGITLSEAQIESAGIETGRLVQGSIQEHIECTGTIDVPPNYRTTLHSMISANVVDIRVLPGNEVKRGEVLAIMEHPNIIDLQVQFVHSKAEKERLDLELARKIDLHKSNVTSEKELQQIKSEHTIAVATYQSLLKKLELVGLTEKGVASDGIVSRIPIRSTIDGKVGEVHVNSGSFVELNRPLFTITNETHLHLELEVFANDAIRVIKGQKIQFSMPGLDRIYSGEVELINPEVSESNTVRVHGHISDLGSYKIGSFLEARIIVSETNVSGISSTELIIEGEDSYLFKGSAEGFVKTWVKTGLQDKNFTQILTDTTASDWVVKGNYYLNGM